MQGGIANYHVGGNNHRELWDGEASVHNTRSRTKKLAIAIILVVLITLAVLDSTIGQGRIGDGLHDTLEWIEDNPIGGIFVFIVVYFVATVFFVPGSILTLGGGFVFANAFGLGMGLLLGTIAVFVGASAGAITAFLIARYLLRDWVCGLTAQYTMFAALDAALAEKGFRIMVLLRLSPLIPFNALDYMAGVTAIGFWKYFWALFAMLPGIILYVFLGASAGSLTDSANSGNSMTVTVIVVAVGIVFGALAVALTSYYARQELDSILQAREVALQDETDRKRVVESASNAEETNTSEDHV